MSLPPASEGFVQVDQVGKSLLMDKNFVLLSLKEGSLGIKQGEMAVNTMIVTRFRDGQGLIALFDQSLLGMPLFSEGRTGDQCIGDLPERSLDSFFVSGDGNIAVGFSQFEVGAQPASLKDRERHLWGEAPDTARPGHEEIRQAGAGVPGGTGKSYAGEK